MRVGLLLVVAWVVVLGKLGMFVGVELEWSGGGSCLLLGVSLQLDTIDRLLPQPND